MNFKRVCIVATAPFVLKWFMAPHVKKLSEIYHVTLVANGHDDALVSLLGDNVSFISIEIERKISLRSDIISFFKLWRLFQKSDFISVHSIMPKSGLLAMLAAKISGVPLRFHTFTGQVWATKKGIARYFLKRMDMLIAGCSTVVLADSPSQKIFLVQNKIMPSENIRVLANGSIAGVDLRRFSPDAAIRKMYREKFNIPDNAIIYLFVGRLTKDKGIIDLINAFAKICDLKPDLHLMVVGPDEGGISNAVQELERQFPGHVHQTGFTNTPEEYMMTADVFCLPSYREGFGSSIIEAAAIGLPAIASRIYGVIDAVKDNMTGILHEPGDIDGISNAMYNLATNYDLRIRLGMAAREWVKDHFSEQSVTQAFLDFYDQQISMVESKNIL